MARSWHKRGPAALSRGAVVSTALLFALLLPARADAVAPTVKATWASEVNATSFRARGVLDTGTLNTTYRFDYISLAAYEANVGSGKDGFAGASHAPVAGEVKVLGSTVDQEVAQRLGGLNAATAYRFRLVAKNSNGESVGPPRTVITQEATTNFELAENRGWEMVSPVDKNGGGVAFPGELFDGGAFQAAGSGNSVTYGSASSFGEAAGAPGASQYVSVRTPSGWSTRNLTLPTAAGAFGADPDGAPYRILSTDLSRALALTQPHSFELLGVTPTLSSLASWAGPDLRFAGATQNLSHVVLATCEALTPDSVEVPAGEGCDPAFPNLYLADEEGLSLINLGPGSPVGAPGVALAASAGAVSSGGSRIYWVDPSGALIVRDGDRSLLVDSEGEFQAASSDGTIAYFTKGSHLYRYSLAGESAIDLTPAGGVQGVFGTSTAGDYVYYLDGSGVKAWHTGSIATVAATADVSNFPPATGAARVSGDGTRLAFLSGAPLTDYDPEGAMEVYRYDAIADTLLCASCNPYGARPLGPSTLPGAIANGSEARFYKPRAMDAGGSRLFFDSLDALVPGDTNGELDVYEWRAQGLAGCARPSGCLGLLSSGTAAEASAFIDASEDGKDVFFLTDASLVSADLGGVDVYDARVDGGFPEAEPPIPCVADACQPLPPEPDDPTPGTLFYGSEANPTPRIDKPMKKKRGKKRKHRHRNGSKKKAGKRMGAR